MILGDPFRKAREETLSLIEREKLIVIVRGVKREKLLRLADALAAGGLHAMEITFDACADPLDEEIAERIEMLVRATRGKMVIGAGTVLTEKQLRLAKEAGARFVVSPNCREEIVRKTREFDMVSIPGALTPTEVEAAHRFGADFVKIFPALALGPSYIRALKAPLSHIRMIAVNGILPEQIGEYLSAGADGFAIGGAIAERKALEKDDYEAITRNAAYYRELILKGK